MAIIQERGRLLGIFNLPPSPPTHLPNINIALRAGAPEEGRRAVRLPKILSTTTLYPPEIISPCYRGGIFNQKILSKIRAPQSMKNVHRRVRHSLCERHSSAIHWDVGSRGNPKLPLHRRGAAVMELAAGTITEESSTTGS